MAKVELTKVLDMLISEEQDKATGLLHQWFVEQSKAIHESLMQEDDMMGSSDLTGDIQDDQDEIKSEEYYGEADEEAEGEDIVDGGEEGEDVGGDVDGALDGEMAPEEMPIGDRVEDLEADIERLKAEFRALVGGEDEVVDGVEDQMGGEGASMDPEGFASGEEEVADESMMHMREGEETEEEEEDIEESFSDEDFAALEESFELEKIADPKLNGGKEIGADGKTVQINDHSPLPNRKPSDRVGGTPVVVHGPDHKGYERENAPTVKTRPGLKNEIKNAMQNLTPVSKEGNKAALLNKKGDGFGSDSPKSPIGGGNEDLRGNADFKRK